MASTTLSGRVATARWSAMPVDVAAVAGSLAVYGAMAVVALRYLPGTDDFRRTDAVWFSAWLTFVVAGALILWERPGHRVGRLLVAIGGTVQLAGLLNDVATLLVDRHAPTVVAGLTAWASGLLFVPPLGMGAALLLLYPDGRTPREPRRRLLLLGCVAATAVGMLGLAITPGRVDDLPVTNPLGIASLSGLATALEIVGEVGLGLLIVACCVSLAGRWRSAGPAERPALAHLALAAVVLAVTTIAGLVSAAAGLHGSAVGAVVEAVAIAAIPVATGMAVLRANLFDIELALRRTLSYVVVSALVLAAYVAVVLGLGRATRVRGSLELSLLITFVVAIALSPLRDVAQRQVDRVLYGRRGDPYGVLRDLDRRLSQTRSPGEVLPTVAAAVADALRLPHVEIVLAGDLQPVVHGAPRTVARELELTHHGHQIGRLRLAARSPGERFSALDERLLVDVAEHVSTAAAAVVLSDDAQRSRERLVRALEDVRRQVHRDLHDDLGPVLGGIALQLDALRRLTADDPEAHELASTIRDEVADAVIGVRRLVHGMRPPVLDELGLVDALTQYGDQLAGGLVVTVRATSDVPELPAAVEVAAYRIVTEALTNAVRHAGASRTDVVIGWDSGRLVLDVSDDGCGIGPGSAPGLGLASMRERAAELGGTLTVTSGAGVRIRAELPGSAR